MQINQKPLKWYITLYYYFSIYLPVILLNLMILVVFLGFLFNYIFVLLDTSDTNRENYPFSLTSTFDTAFTKGLILLIIVSFFAVLLFVSIIRTVVMDPGYMPSPLEVEVRIAMSQTTYKEKEKEKEQKTNRASSLETKQRLINNESQLDDLSSDFFDINSYNKERKLKFLNEFKKVISNGPLNDFEHKKYTDKITEFLNEERKTVNRPYKLKYKNTNINDLDAFLANIDLLKTTFCGTCNRYKVERSHHCRQCGRCILKMDHHCPWLANCIGFYNYKYFLLIDFYGICAIIPILATYWEALINYNASTNATLATCLFTSLSFTIAIGLFGFMIWLVYVNWRLCFSAQTVIENSDRERFPLNKTTNIYDLGLYKNFCSVFGTNPLTWFLPIDANYAGKGIVFDNIYNTLTN